MNPWHLAVLPRRLCGAMLLWAGGGMQIVAAQAPAAADPRFAPAAERAHKEGDKVFKWIILNGASAKRVGPAAAPEPAPSPAAAPPARPPASAKATAPAPAVKPSERPAPAEAPPPAARAEATPAPVVAAPPPAASSAPSVPLPPPPRAYTATEPVAEPPPQEDPPLVLVHQVEPEFPVTILRRQKKGGVLVRFVVQADGRVVQPEVVKSTNPYLNPYAIQAVAQWKFQPLPREQSATAELSFDLRQTLSE